MLFNLNNPSKKTGFTSREPAFTLVELLVVVTIFAGLGILLVNSLFAILKSNTKSELIKEIRQNGSFALDVMTKKLTGGQNPTCDVDSSWVSFTDSHGEEITFSCDAGGYIASESAGIKTALTSNQAFGSEEKIKISLTSCSFGCEAVGTNSKVTISFTLSQAGEPIRQEELTQQTFSKVVLVRNQ
ncbi:MAG: type II secretion system protein [Candidatus Shapirobacteria bacterium]|nr:type II secretion system protein [Candidatus Shapirobacteria bacterium]MDD5481536.1 type II secretion system protein [Candidatus Shapirobacteria bacterium]